MPRKILSLCVVLNFSFSLLTPVPQAHAQNLLNLPEPGAMVNLSPAYEPVILKGVTVHKDNPFLFDFIVDSGQDHAQGEALKQEGQKLIKYFLASLAIPEKDLWVNLSPYEQDRTIPEALGQTEMGRDLLAQDYILKQITASLIYPEKTLGRNFWDRVYAKAQQLYGTSEIPVNTFNKVWIMADKAEIFERNQTAFVVGMHLKVMLEEDYLASSRHPEGARQPKDLNNSNFSDRSLRNSSPAAQNDARSVAGQVIKEIILPELEKEVNTGKSFSNLRQITSALILASWYKNNLKQALLNQVYADKNKVAGIELDDPAIKEKIYQRYVQAYKKGVFNFIKEEDSQGAVVPRKYFSGGWDPAMAAHPQRVTDEAMLGQSIREAAGRLMSLATGMVSTSLSDAAMANDGKFDFGDIFKGEGISARGSKELINVVEADIYVEGGEVVISLKLDDGTWSVGVKVEGVTAQNLESIQAWWQQYRQNKPYTNGALTPEQVNHLKKAVAKALANDAAMAASSSREINGTAGKINNDQLARVLSSIYKIRVTKEERDEFEHDDANPFRYDEEIAARKIQQLLNNGQNVANEDVIIDPNMERLKSEYPVLLKKEDEFRDWWNGLMQLSSQERRARKKGISAKQAGEFLAAKVQRAREFAVLVNDAAMAGKLEDRVYSNRRAGSSAVADPANGGIDLNASAIQWNVRKDGKGVEMNLDPAMLERVRKQGIQGLTPVIFRITPVVNIWPLMGMEPPKPAQRQQIAKM